MWLIDCQSELERERAMRIYVFPRLKDAGKLTDAEAQIRLDRLDGAISVMQTLRDAGILQIDQLVLRLTPAPPTDKRVRTTVHPPIIKGGE